MTLGNFICGAVVPVGFGLLFLAGGISKSLRKSSVLHAVSNYRLLPPLAARAVAHLLAPVEAISGALLLLSLLFPVYQLAWTLATGLLFVFTIAVASALMRGLSIPCGCGILLAGHTITWATLARNLVMLAVLALDFWMRREHDSAVGLGFTLGQWYLTGAPV